MSALLAASDDMAVFLFGLALTGALFLALGLFAFVLVLRAPQHDPYVHPFGDVPHKRRRAQ